MWPSDPEPTALALYIPDGSRCQLDHRGEGDHDIMLKGFLTVEVIFHPHHQSVRLYQLDD